MTSRRSSILTALALIAAAPAAWAQQEGTDVVKTDWGDAVWQLWLLAPLGAAAALVFAYVFHRQMRAASPGNDTMIRIAAAVRKGAMAYLFQQYKVVAIVFLVLCAIFSVMAFAFNMQHGLVPFAFLTGGLFSGLCGFLGMNTATQASSRTAQAASQNLNDGLRVAFRSGAVMGFVVVGFGLLDIAAWFYVCNNLMHLPLGEVTVVMLSFGMGASTQALFARVGGGIYTKAADVGSDLVGKVEAGIPEDDPRNPATIADNVGDNVGDVAGMGADLYESYCGSILSTAALGFATAQSLRPGVVEATLALPWVVFPMAVAGAGNVLSALSTFAVRTGEDTSLKNLMAALFRGINLATALTALAALAIGHFLLKDSPLIASSPTTLGISHYVWGVWLAVVVGLVAGVIVAKAAEYYTSNDYRPVQDLAGQAVTGPATVIIDGVAVGMMSTGVPVLTVAIGIYLSFWISGGFEEPVQGLYGIAIAAVGMLSTLGITLATDAYGPIADNAGGNATMSKLDPKVRERTDALDALGNTTAATGKGFAIASAALTAMALLAAYVEEVRAGLQRIAVSTYDAGGPAAGRIIDVNDEKEVPDPNAFKDLGHGMLAEKRGKSVRGWLVLARHQRTASAPETSPAPPATWTELRAVPVETASLRHFMDFYEVTLMNPNVLIGLFIGSMMVFVFCAMTMKAVGRAARSMVEEVRRQFRQIPGIMDGTAEPDYASCVAISTRGAQREMITPSLLAISVPVAVGIFLGVSGVMGLLAGGLSTGFVVAIMMAAAGGAWDNAKKWIESGQLKNDAGEVLGKGTPAHKAAVVGDTVGDPFKDTSGPSLNILIKLMSMVSIVFVGLTLALGGRLTELMRG
jgi:H(+)-translocating pyrophosphatase